MGRSSPLVKKWSIYQRILGTTCMSNQIARGQGCGNSLSENEGYIRCTENSPLCRMSSMPYAGIL